jgi:thiol-disulfide isomerase/thioredoxin
VKALVRAFIAVLSVAGALLVGGAAAAGTGPITGISGTDPLTGKTVSLDHWRGRAVAINVWASWCEGCTKEARALRRFEQAHPNAVLGIDFNDSRAGARAFYRRYDLDHPSIWDPKGRLVTRLKAIGLPTTVFLNRRHEVVLAIAGAGTYAQFEDAWRLATKGPARKPARVPAPLVKTGFVTPSGNVICNAGPYRGKPLLACTVLSAASPTKGQKLWSMTERGKVQVGYLIGDAASDLARLQYGFTWRWNGFRCTSAQKGLTCHNLAGHGYFLSRKAQRVF